MLLNIVSLPVELIYEIQLFAIEPAFPLLSKRLHFVFTQAPLSSKANYLLLRALTASNTNTPKGSNTSRPPQALTHALRYPLCTPDVLRILLTMPDMACEKRPEPPVRLFRSLAPNQPRRETSALALLRVLCAPGGPGIAAGAREGYALARAVYARSHLLVRLLLDQGADPSAKDSLCVKIAIRARDLDLVRMLVEREYVSPSERAPPRRLVRATETPAPAMSNYEGNSNGALDSNARAKRRRMGDRVEVTPAMLREAVEVNADDIVDWLCSEKGCKADMQTLRMMSGSSKQDKIASPRISSGRKRSRARR